MGLWTKFTDFLAGEDSQQRETEIQEMQKKLDQARDAREQGASREEILAITKPAEDDLKRNTADASKPSLAFSFFNFLSDVGSTIGQAMEIEGIGTAEEGSLGKKVGDALNDLAEKGSEGAKVVFEASQSILGKLTLPIALGVVVFLMIKN